MNWENRYDGFNKGDRIRIIGDNHSSDYKMGEECTLKNHYITNGEWTMYSSGFVHGDGKENYWNTEECDNGIEEGSMELVHK